MEAAKILLSAEEINLVCDTHWLLTKNSIIEKTRNMFGELAAQLQQKFDHNRHSLPEAVQLFSPKVFKGEYYQGLPYVMLDYPRVFTRDEVFAIRTMFWWGNFFSVTLQLKGSYQRMFADALTRNKQLLIQHNFYASVSGDEWRHDFEPENYQLLSSNENLLQQAINGSFLKIAVRIPVVQWNDAANVLAGYHGMLVGLLTA
jgi:hypothetical protein